MPELSLDRYEPLLRTLLDQAAREQIYLIARLQRVEAYTLTVNNGKTESMTATLSQGLGMHVFTASGHTAFATVDQLEPQAALNALTVAITSARAAAAANLEANRAIFDLPATQARTIP